MENNVNVCSRSTKGLFKMNERAADQPLGHPDPLSDLLNTEIYIGKRSLVHRKKIFGTQNNPSAEEAKSPQPLGNGVAQRLKPNRALC